jgi:4-hydroxy-3-polyprenylbenzoate decarboxylase
MAYNDLREYIGALEAHEELTHVTKEVDANLEIGAIIRRGYDLRAPAPLFESIKGYPRGHKLMGGVVGPGTEKYGFFSRVALSFGLDPGISYGNLVEEYVRLRSRRVKPVLVKDGPCKENVRIGDQVNLFEFPAPYIHDGDGGQYIGTWHTIVTKDPDTGWINWGIHMLMLHDQRTMGGLLNPFQHIGLHFYQKHEARGKPMEFAVALGTEPVTPIMSVSHVPAGVNEVDVIGGIRGEPLPVIRCETVDLEVPATSEIVLEGIVAPGERREEGPFAEYTGYTAGGRLPLPVYHVKAITFRNDPILPCNGVSANNGRIVVPVTRAGDLLTDLRERGFQIRMVYIPPEMVVHCIVLSARMLYPNYATVLAHAVWSTRVGSHTPYLIVVDEDIDPTRMSDVLWTLATRCHPDRGIHKVPNSPGHGLMPYLSEYEKRNFLGANVLFDCTWPKGWPKEQIPRKSTFESLWPKEVQDRVLAGWEEYGFKKPVTR